MKKLTTAKEFVEIQKTEKIKSDDLNLQKAIKLVESSLQAGEEPKLTDKGLFYPIDWKALKDELSKLYPTFNVIYSKDYSNRFGYYPSNIKLQPKRAYCCHWYGCGLLDCILGLFSI